MISDGFRLDLSGPWKGDFSLLDSCRRFGIQKSNPKWQGNNLPQYPLLIKIHDQVLKLSQKFKHHKPSKIRGSGIILLMSQS